MKTLERYVFRSFLTAFFLAWLILSFVLTIGLMVKIIELMIDGLPAAAIGQFVLVSFPGTLFLTVPLGLLVSALLVFSRLSADSEIAAMRACGVNMLTIIRWPLAFGALCTALCWWINNEIVPRSHERQRALKYMVSVDTGLDLLEPGRMIDEFDDMKVYFGHKDGNWLYDLRVFDNTDEKGTRVISADKALVTTNRTDIRLDLYKVTMDPVEVGKPGIARAERFRHTIPDALGHRSFRRKYKDMGYAELSARIGMMRQEVASAHDEGARKALASDLSYALVTLVTRGVYAAAAICFVLIGVPLGIKTQRKESSIGMAVSLAVALGYYLFVILAQSLESSPAFFPQYLVWTPVVLCAALASWLIPKNL